MSHTSRFGRAYNTEMLRNKARLSKEHVTDAGSRDAAWRETPGLGNAQAGAFAPKATRIS